MLTVIVSFFFSYPRSILSLLASMVGVTALIFLAKGFVIGQILVMIFATLYGLASLKMRYYGEMITYLCMTAPTALAALVSWIRHPYKQTHQVEVARRLTWKSLALMVLSASAVTVAFYFILGALGTENLEVSTMSVATSWFASMLMVFRSPYYAVGYAVNDIVLIVMWIMASLESVSYVPMVACFFTFFFNDLYGFVSWQKMKKSQI